jgi:hypothetical protein
MSSIERLTEWRSAAANRSKRLLLVTAHYPPDPAVGSLRWMHFTRYLAEAGWTVDVLTGWNPVTDKHTAVMARLPAGVRIFGIQPRPSRFAQTVLGAWKLVKRPANADTPSAETKEKPAPSASPVEESRESWAQRVRRGLLALMEFRTQVSWADAVVEQAEQLIGQGAVYAAVASSGPPHAAHVAAHEIARANRLPHLADLRDPWSLVERVPEHIDSPLWYTLARREEKRVFGNAAIIALNTDRSCDEYRSRYPHLAARMVTIRNGSDDEVIPVADPHSDFRVRFAGSVYIDRDPRLLFRAAARTIEALGLSPSQFSFGFMGHVERSGGVDALMTAASEEGIAEFMDVRPAGPRSEAMKFLAGAQLLVSLPQDSHMAIPAKIYEYVLFPAWLLVLAEQRSATAELLRGSGADVVHPEDVEQMTQVITRAYQSWRNGVRPTPVGEDGQFDRRKQGAILLEKLGDITS